MMYYIFLFFSITMVNSFCTGILHLNQDVLLKMDFLQGAQFLTRLPDDISSDQLFKSIQSINTSVGKQTFNQIVDKHSVSFLE